ncbi:MAG TPA: hypothetical protein VMQ58_03240 [Candidatus Saccharimonadales bacterium]|jgi:ABC-type multidrug transport system fused ATPase/permease subunit|nr:hypothetical protein [Candidatus Saccharimonadales bacterium]
MSYREIPPSEESDKIIVIENGKIIESGSHKTLMELNKIYASLFTMQAESYK